MDRHYVLPIAFAAAAHGALFFGFSPTTRSPAPKPPEDKRISVWAAPPPEEMVKVEADTGSTKPKSEPEAPILPRSIEPVPIDRTDTIAIPVPPVRSFTKTDAAIILPAVERGGVGGGPEGIISREFLDNSPRTRFQAAPLYPFEAKRQGLNGDVLVEFVVDEQGRVLEPRVIQSSNRIFEEATLRAVAKWVFEPGRRNGRIVRFRMAVPVIFNLNNE